jgi:hypothetical protein
VRGVVSQWVGALGPGGSLDALEHSGSRALTDTVLSGFAQAASRATAAA